MRNTAAPQVSQGLSPPGLASFFSRAPKLNVIIAIAVGAFGFFVASEASYMKAKAHLAQFLLERAWTRTLAGEADARAWRWADVTPVAKLSAPRYGASQVILSDASGEAMAFGPGWMAGTPYPGEPGLSIIAAHRDTHFRFLKNIEKGDVISVTTKSGERLRFSVRDMRIVRAETSGLAIEGAAPQIALVTCYPFDALTRGPYRYVVIGDLIEGAVSSDAG